MLLPRHSSASEKPCTGVVRLSPSRSRPLFPQVRACCIGLRSTASGQELPRPVKSVTVGRSPSGNVFGQSAVTAPPTATSASSKDSTMQLTHLVGAHAKPCGAVRAHGHTVGLLSRLPLTRCSPNIVGHADLPSHGIETWCRVFLGGASQDVCLFSSISISGQNEYVPANRKLGIFR